jgi:hypothetical protein
MKNLTKISLSPIDLSEDRYKMFEFNFKPSEVQPKPVEIYEHPMEKQDNHWTALHLYAVKNESNWDVEAAKKFINFWESQIPKACCFQKYKDLNVELNPSSPASFFASANEAHNSVSRQLTIEKKPHKLFNLAQSYGIWRREGLYESTPTLPHPTVDIIIPFHQGDQQFVSESIQALLSQNNVVPIIHLVSDSDLLFPEVPTSVRKYRTTGKWGPYRIANSIVRYYAQSSFIALQDADDISHPDRLWKQIATMQKYGYEMTSCSMEQFLCPTYTDKIKERYECEPLLKSGTKFFHVPGGRCINSCRTMTKAMFERVNGFPDQMCSVDFHLDNVAWLLDIPIFWSTQILGRRRLHKDSITNGAAYAVGTPLREACNKYVSDALKVLQQNPTLEQARKFGALDIAKPLERLS